MDEGWGVMQRGMLGPSWGREAGLTRGSRPRLISTLTLRKLWESAPPRLGISLG